MRASKLLALASVLFLFAGAVGESSRAEAAGGGPGGSSASSTDLVAIRAEVNGLAVTVRADGTLAPASMGVGASEQFELRNVGKGVIALRSVSNGKFVSAHDLGPMRADAEGVGMDQLFHTVGGSDHLIRLRSAVANGFVCATQRGQGVMAVTKHCPH